MLPVAVDTETAGETKEGALHPDDGQEVKVVSVKGQGKPAVAFYLYQMSPDEIRGLYARLRERTIIMAPARFDLLALSHAAPLGGVDLCDNLEWDVQVVSRIIEPTREVKYVFGERMTPHQLKHLAFDHLGPESIEPEVQMYNWLKENKVTKKKSVDKSKIYLAPFEILDPYAKMDADITFRLRNWQWERVAKMEDDWPNLWQLIHREMQICKLLHRMEQRGIGWDTDRAQIAVRKLSTAIGRIEGELPFGTKPDEVRKWFFEDHHYIEGVRTATDKYSINEEVRTELVKVKAPYAKEYDNLVKLKSAQSKWYEGWTNRVGKDGRLRTTINQNGAETFRLSVGRIQLQAIPHDFKLRLPDGVPTVKDLFIPKPGHVLWEFDVSQAEVRIATSIARCKAMREIIQEDKEDLHTATCRILLNSYPGDANFDQYRTIAKRLRFATIYGAGARGLKEQLDKFVPEMGLSEHDARRFLRLDRKQFPEFVTAAHRAEQVMKERGYVRLCSGMRRYFGMKDDTHKAFNAVIQGGVAESMKDWQLQVEARYPGAQLLQIHDSLVCELPFELADEAAQEIVQIGVNIFEGYFNILFKIGAKQWQAA